MHVELIAITQPVNPEWQTENVIEMAGRICYNQEGKTGTGNTKEFIKARLAEHHESIIEHCSATVAIYGISRTCLAQITRHRLASFSVMSQRFTDQRSVLDCVMPDTIAKNETARQIYEKAMCGSDMAYTMLRNLGIPKQDARFALLEATTTKLLMTANFREWQHIIELRCDKRAQHEIRKVCTEILKLLYAQAPSVFGDLAQRYLSTVDKERTRK